MVEIIDRVTLDFDRDRIYGWQLFTNLRKVAGMVKALELGYDLPDVDVVKRDGVYFLCKEQKSDVKQWGGHSRTIAKYVVGRNFFCNVWDEDNPEKFKNREYYDIKNAVLRDNPLRKYSYYNKLKEADARVVSRDLGDSMWGFQRFLDSELE